MHRVVPQITLGERLRTLRAGEMAVHRVRYDAHRRFPPHAHDRANLTFVLAGEMAETANGSTHTLHSCDAVIKPAHTVHCNHCGPSGARTLVIEIPPSDAASLQYARLRGIEAICMACRLAEIIQHPTSAAREDVREIIIEALALASDQLSDATTDTANRVRRVQDLLQQGYALPLRIGDLAHLVDVHPVYLARVFRRRHGCTISQYRRRLQLTAAARMLGDGHESIAAIAQRSGFADQSHLCRAFRGACGTSPAAFRRMLVSA